MVAGSSHSEVFRLEYVDDITGVITVYELVMAGGVIMIPILLCSVIALAIIFERFWSLRSSRIAPENFVNDLLLKLKKRNSPVHGCGKSKMALRWAECWWLA
jgi:biopolymer transport protein ExbB/TolQ